VTTTTLERINALNRERFSLLQGGARKDTARTRRIEEIKGELDTLWDERRREQAVELQGIDRVIDAAYERVYGTGYREAVAPTLVADSGERQRKAA
jgi:hypothetical protein